MLLVPRSYQTECVTSIYNYFGTCSGNPVCALPTGTGKSVVIAMFLYSVFSQYARQKVLVLTHVKELIQQNYEKLLAFWPGAPAGINSAGLKQRDTMQPIIFAGIQSVAEYYASFGIVDLVIIDEAHLVSPEDATRYQLFINGLMSINPNLKVIGFTATPWRLGHGRITEGEGALFTDICFDITGIDAFNRLIAEGYLAPLVPKRTSIELDVEGVHMRGNEYILSELQTAVDKEKLTRAALTEVMDVARDRKKWLIFASGVQHTENVSHMLENEFGVYCPAIHRGTRDRDKFIKAFRKGDVQAVVNNNILTTGLDVPDIDLIVMLRPTASPVLWVQMLGRGTRPVYAPGFDVNDYTQRWEAIHAGGKNDCLVLDFAGNTRRLGPINDPVIPRKKGEKGGDAPIKICDEGMKDDNGIDQPGCGAYNHTSVRKCTGCGLHFPIHNKLNVSASTEELIKGELPITEVFKVDHITFSQHNKKDRAPSMKITYYCGIRNFTEYVCPEHGGPITRKALRWWSERAGTVAPSTTAQMIERADEVRSPTHLRVWINKQHPQIMAYCFDGTAFGAQVPSDSDPGPSTEIRSSQPGARTPWTDRLGSSGNPGNGGAYYDDDIPF